MTDKVMTPLTVSELCMVIGLQASRIADYARANQHSIGGDNVKRLEEMMVDLDGSIRLLRKGL